MNMIRCTCSKIGLNDCLFEEYKNCCLSLNYKKTQSN